MQLRGYFQVFQVLSAIDIDSDGMIKVDHVTKVLELLVSVLHDFFIRH
jgi:hypothetical protein